MKTKLDLIKNYPPEAPGNWGKYFGYPEAICKYLTDMADVADWQNIKIAVLNDFSFQMINFLIKVKNVPLQNIYFLVSEDNEIKDEIKIESMKEWYSNFVGNEIFSYDYINNMVFDLIIGNPPYGKSSSLAQQIIVTVKVYAKQSIWLVPVNTCKYDEVLKSCESVNILSRADSNLFEGATTGRLSLLKISPKTNNNSFLVYEDLILSTLDKKLIELRKATKAYNEKIGTKSIYTIDGSYLLKKYDKTLKEASKQTLPKTFESIANRNVKDLRDEGYCFYNTVRSTVDGVHFTDGYDRRYNFEGIWDNKVDTAHSGDLLCFESKEARNNFRDWWYSCTKKYANKVECNRRGLTNMYLTLLGNCVSLSAGIGYYIDYFPQVDWSHPWTDQEILKEIGLPEDFLGE